MAIPSLPFLVTTRIIAGLLIAVVPLYVIGLMSSYFATRRHPVLPPSAGTYDHYFELFHRVTCSGPSQVLVFAIVIILIHCYHGYTASGGPAGVGVAVGRPSGRRSWPSTSSTCSSRWPSGAPPRPCGWRGKDSPSSERPLKARGLRRDVPGALRAVRLHDLRRVHRDPRRTTKSPCSPPRSAVLPARADVKVAAGGGARDRDRRGRRQAHLGLFPRTCGSRSPPTSPGGSCPRRSSAKYVSLIVPEGEGADADPIEEGAVIKQAEVAVEVEEVLNDLFPLLRRPARRPERHARRNRDGPGGSRRQARRGPGDLQLLPRQAQPGHPALVEKPRPAGPGVRGLRGRGPRAGAAVATPPRPRPSRSKASRSSSTT